MIAGVRTGMAAVGTPYENAKANRIFKILRYEEVYMHDYQSFAEAACSQGGEQVAARACASTFAAAQRSD